jgi:uncharacterized protein (DUF927 family)
MTEKELLRKETFLELFKLDGIDRIAKEDELFIEAKNLGLEKKFKDSLKKYEKLLKEKIILKEDLKLPKSKYDIQFLETGKYMVTKDGIIDTKADVKFSFFPVIPVERYINEETSKEKIKIIFYKENKWHEMIVDKSQVSVNQKLLLLSDYGLDVNSENVRYYINYFSTIMNLNEINKLSSVSHIGWSGDNFIPYDSKGIFDGEDTSRSTYKAISSKGDYKKWKEVVSNLRKKKIIKILMAVTFASPLLEKLNLQPFIVNVWSSISGNGKTLSCMVAMSSWGNTENGALRLSSNNTQNYYITIASFMRNITCYFDELQIIKNAKTLNMENLIMDLCNGTDKGRLTKSSQTKQVKNWHNNFLFTNNDSLVKENAGEQVYNRVIDIEIREKLIDESGSEIAKIIKNNYGFAGKEYIKYIKKIGIDIIFDRYKKIYSAILQEISTTEKQASSLASIIIADELICECIFKNEKPLQIEDIREYANDKEAIKTSMKAKSYIIDIINANRKRFEDTNYGENWGKIKTINGTYQICYINAQILYRELEKKNFEFDSVKKEWAEMKFLKTNSQGRYVHNTTLYGEKGCYVELDLTL